MNSRSEPDERRKQRRFQVGNGAFAVARPKLTKLGQIIDIGLGGLAFRYVVTGTWANGAFEVDIFLVNDGFYLEKVPIQLISDIRVPKTISKRSLPMRRCGVQFGELTENQVVQLEYFIKIHATREV